MSSSSSRTPQLEVNVKFGDHCTVSDTPAVRGTVPAARQATPGARGLRTDARRNVEKLRSAAMEVFSEAGLGAPLDDVARRAGVSTGTLYHRFGDRDGLIEAVVSDLAGDHLRGVLEAVERHEDPWPRFRTFLCALFDLQVREPALNDVFSGHYPTAAGIASICDRSLDYGDRLITAAQAQGTLRADFDRSDLEALLRANAALVRDGAVDDNATRRRNGYLIDGLAAR
jgi:AcrR family transcriptional regulator